MKTEDDIRQAVEVMRRGGVILYPTDTVWGIGCDATNAEAVARIYRIKQRDDSKAMICLVDSDARVQRYVRDVPSVAWDLFEYADKPTTLILDGAVNLAPNLVGGDGSIAIRITREDFSRELCYRMQKPVVSTSANISGEPAAQPVLDALGVKPILQAGMRLGEGTGAVAIMPILDMAMAVYNGDTFDDLQMEAYTPQS